MLVGVAVGVAVDVDVVVTVGVGGGGANTKIICDSLEMPFTKTVTSA